MTYEKKDETIVLTLEKEDAALVKEIISTACLPQKRNFFGLMKFIGECYPDLK